MSEIYQIARKSSGTVTYCNRLRDKCLEILRSETKTKHDKSANLEKLKKMYNKRKINRVRGIHQVLPKEKKWRTPSRFEASNCGHVN